MWLHSITCVSVKSIASFWVVYWTQQQLDLCHVSDFAFWISNISWPDNYKKIWTIFVGQCMGVIVFNKLLLCKDWSDTIPALEAPFPHSLFCLTVLSMWWSSHQERKDNFLKYEGRIVVSFQEAQCHIVIRKSGHLVGCDASIVICAQSKQDRRTHNTL